MIFEYTDDQVQEQGATATLLSSAADTAAFVAARKDDHANPFVAPTVGWAFTANIGNYHC